MLLTVVLSWEFCLFNAHSCGLQQVIFPLLRHTLSPPPGGLAPGTVRRVQSAPRVAAWHRSKPHVGTLRVGSVSPAAGYAPWWEKCPHSAWTVDRGPLSVWGVFGSLPVQWLPLLVSEPDQPSTCNLSTKQKNFEGGIFWYSFSTKLVSELIFTSFTISTWFLYVWVSVPDFYLFFLWSLPH